MVALKCGSVIAYDYDALGNRIGVVENGVRTDFAYADWSDTANPNNVWRYNEGANLLPGVNDWQSAFAGANWSQPGWARSENGTNRIPFWFQSNGLEPFGHDWLSGDVVVHTTDAVNGAGNGEANVTWTSELAI